MGDRRGSRFALEVLFLVGLAAALTIAKLKPLEIAGIMLVGWLIVALLEWASWRDQPHYGSGLPPRYYVPQLNLPPAQPLEQVFSGYPDSHREEAPTWIASAAVRAEVLGDWPMAAPAGDGAPGAAEQDPWTVEELPAEPLEERGASAEPQPVAVLQPVPTAAQEPLDAARVNSARGVARYSLDPLGEAPQRRRFGRNADTGTVEVSARPRGPRPLPGRANRQD